MNTKNKILCEALNLFSEKGFQSVYVGDIAAAVGIQTPSLYKHYKSKQDIFDTCVKVFSERMEKIQNELQLPGSKNATISYKSVTEEQLVEVAYALFLFYLQDEVASKFRKMLMIERYHNAQLNQLFEDLFIRGAIEHEEKIFSELIREHILRGDDPHILAIRFYTPIFYLLQKYDMHTDQMDEARVELTTIVREFCEIYKGGV